VLSLTVGGMILILWWEIVSEKCTANPFHSKQCLSEAHFAWEDEVAESHSLQKIQKTKNSVAILPFAWWNKR
jgi:hypothetical protein